ncbi:peptidoglycan-binding domain-containing protein [Streptomyces sp. NPDC047009]|uniref:peptidoglycan-binding domain-containing protein n=1 Tax=unclassified Streptomyces TaxID=2593676 RepID=UPI0033C8201B
MTARQWLSQPGQMVQADVTPLRRPHCLRKQCGLLVHATASVASLPICTADVEATGVSGLWLEVPGTSSGSSSCYLAPGDYSDAVSALQFSMVRCYGKSIAVDGDFGPATRNALLSVQRTIGAAQDGVYGTETRGKMLHAGTGNGCQKWSHDGWT